MSLTMPRKESLQVFLSYDQADEAFAKALSAELTKRGLSVWRDVEELLPGDNWALEVGGALKKSKAMVVLVSPASMRSTWVRREIEYALGELRYKDRLFPVLVRQTDDVPWILRELNMLSARQGAAKIGESIADALKQVA
jgi:TIR domain